MFMQRHLFDGAEADGRTGGDCVEGFVKPNRLWHRHDRNLSRSAVSDRVIPEIRRKDNESRDGLIEFLRNDVADDERIQRRKKFVLTNASCHDSELAPGSLRVALRHGK